MSASRWTRRQLLAAAAAGAVVPTCIPSGVLGYAGRRGAAERIVVGHIGVGGFGSVHLQHMLAFQDEGRAGVAAVCDCDRQRLAAAAQAAGDGATAYPDYRALLEREDIDAVVIATPDHWHALQSIQACQAGKHVYVEKPSSVTVREGEAMVAAARRYRRAVQVGAQGRTGLGAWYTCRAIRNGIVGRVNKVTCWHYASPSGGFDPDEPPPAELDWDLWLGPLRWRPFNRGYHPASFRWLMESGGGQIRDRGAHQFSTILWCMEADEQTAFTVEATGTTPAAGLWDSAVDMEVTYTFRDPDWTLVWGQPGHQVGKTEFGNVFWGEDGHLVLEWEGAYRGAEPEAVNFQVPPGGVEPYRTDEYADFNMNHKADWFKAILDPDYRPAVDIEIGHRTANLCNLGNLAFLLGRKLVWDGHQVVDDPEANRLLSRPERYPYCTPASV